MSTFDDPWDVYAPETGDNLAGMVVVETGAPVALTPEDARAMAANLIACAIFAEAQEALHPSRASEPVEGAPPPPAPHGCGLCDDALTFDGMTTFAGRDVATWRCVNCGWWHISADCCEGAR